MKPRATDVIHVVVIHFVLICIHWESSCNDMYMILQNTVELQWLEHIWDHENVFETGVVRANECKS